MGTSKLLAGKHDEMLACDRFASYPGGVANTPSGLHTMASGLSSSSDTAGRVGHFGQSAALHFTLWCVYLFLQC